LSTEKYSAQKYGDYSRAINQGMQLASTSSNQHKLRYQPIKAAENNGMMKEAGYSNKKN